MWKMPAKERIETIIVSSEESAGLSVCTPPHPPHSLEDVQVKRNTRRILHSNHPYYRNVAKHLWIDYYIQNAFHTWINIGCICERTLSAMPRVKSHFRAHPTRSHGNSYIFYEVVNTYDCNLQSQLHCAVTPFELNFTKYTLNLRPPKIII